MTFSDHLCSSSCELLAALPVQLWHFFSRLALHAVHGALCIRLGLSIVLGVKNLSREVAITMRQIQWFQSILDGTDLNTFLSSFKIRVQVNHLTRGLCPLL